MLGSLILNILMIFGDFSVTVPVNGLAPDTRASAATQSWVRHQSDIIWAASLLKSRVPRLFIQELVQTNYKLKKNLVILMGFTKGQ